MAEKVIIEIDAQDNTQAAMRGLLSNFGSLGRAVNDFSTAVLASNNAADLYNRGLTDASVSVADVARAEKEAEQATMRFKESLVALAVDGLKKVYEFGKESLDVTVDLANEVRKFRDVTGQTAEESSRLVQVLDDFKITATDAKAATKKLREEGEVLSVETLAKLSDEFLSLNEGVDRTNFLYEKFGKSGENFAEIMLQGGDAIRSANDAISDNLILTDKQLKQAREYERNLDNVNDSILAYKVAVGNQLLPVVNDLITVENRVNELMEEGLNPYEARRKAALELSEANILERDSSLAASAARMEGLASLYETSEALRDNEEVTKEDQEAIEALTEANQNYLSTIRDFTVDIESYNEKTAELKEEEAKLLEEKQKLIDQGWWAESEAVQDINQKLSDNQAKQEENAKKHEEATKLRMLDMLQEQLAIDGLDKRETEFLLQQGLKWGVYSQQAVDDMREIQNEVAALVESYGTIPALVQTRIQAMYETYGDAARIPSGSPTGNRRAGGGNVSGGKMYEVTEMGMPELLNMNNRQYLMMPPDRSGNVIPVGGASAGTGARGDVTVNLTYAPGMSLGSDSEIKSRLIPLIIQGVQEAKVQGKIQ